MKNRKLLVRHEMTVRDIREMGSCVRLFGSAEHEVCGRYLVNRRYQTKVRIGDLYDRIRHVKNQEGQIIAKRLHPGGKLYFSRNAFVPIEVQPYND